MALLQGSLGYIAGNGWIAPKTIGQHVQSVYAHSSSSRQQPRLATGTSILQRRQHRNSALASSANWTPEDLPSGAANTNIHKVQASVTQPQTQAQDASATLPIVPAQEPVSDVSYSETTKRSLAKAIGWRFTAALITLTSGLLFSKDLSTAVKLVGSDFVTKSGFMFLGERVWNKVNWGKGKTKGKGDGAKRSLAKALVWRVFAAGNTLFCGAILSGNFAVALKIAGSDTVVKTVLYYLYERIWARVEWGKEYDLEFVI